TMGSEMTAAAFGTLGKVRRDPMAMLPFCGYHVGDYFAHWIKMGSLVKKLPHVFNVNWFRKTAEGKWMWPGFGDNMRVLEWIVKRCNGQVEGVQTKIGVSPTFAEFNTVGIDGFTEESFNTVMALDNAEWQAEIAGQEEFFASVGEKLPKELVAQRAALAARMS
ncbi:MAG: phosphoenolpyruvate carboxykinase domain-containing protein, partial [Verrucomicrobiota bacterium]